MRNKLVNCKRKMSFIIQYKEHIKITFLNLKDETAQDLKLHVAKHYSLNNEEYYLSDLGRLVSPNEKLIDMKRRTFTIYFVSHIL